MCPHILTMHKEAAKQTASPTDRASGSQATPAKESASKNEYLDGALVIAGAAAAESSPQTAAGASAPLSKPALATAPRDEEGPLISEADPTSNAG